MVPGPASSSRKKCIRPESSPATITEPHGATATTEGDGTYGYALALSSEPTGEATTTIIPDDPLDEGTLARSRSSWALRASE